VTPLATAALPDLCAGVEQPEDAADAYMGALSAGQVDRAQACVEPGTVPLSTTQSLSATASRSDVYLPDPPTPGSSTFTCRGEGKTIRVTAGTVPGNTFRVTAVAIS
jgi:hypothetical protein